MATIKVEVSGESAPEVWDALRALVRVGGGPAAPEKTVTAREEPESVTDQLFGGDEQAAEKPTQRRARGAARKESQRVEEAGPAPEAEVPQAPETPAKAEAPAVEPEVAEEITQKMLFDLMKPFANSGNGLNTVRNLLMENFGGKMSISQLDKSDWPRAAQVLRANLPKKE